MFNFTAIEFMAIVGVLITISITGSLFVDIILAICTFFSPRGKLKREEQKIDFEERKIRLANKKKDIEEYKRTHGA